MAAAPYLHKPILLILLLPLLALNNSSTKAQITDNNNNNNSMPQLPKFRPTFVVVVAIFICVAVLIGLYCYSRNFRFMDPNNLFRSSAAAGNSISGRHKSGVDPAVLRSFPVMLYSDVKDHRIGSSSLECAVCINEFEDGVSIRLLPDCSHVFHEKCIDTWLASHATCPVCRAVLEKIEPTAVAAEEGIEAAVTVVVVEEEEERRKEMKELERIRIRSRRGGGGGKRAQRKLTRSNSTGHIPGEELERYTLRLPETVRNDIFVAGRLTRERSLPAVRGECNNKGLEGDLGSSGGRGLMMPVKWPSFFLKSPLLSKGFSGGRMPENSSSAKPDLPV